VGGELGAVRATIVSHNTRQLKMQKTETKFAMRSAVRNFASPTRQPYFKILWKTSAFQRIAYHLIFSTASAQLATGRSVSNFHSMRFRPLGALGSTAWMTVRSNVGSRRNALPVHDPISNRPYAALIASHAGRL